MTKVTQSIIKSSLLVAVVALSGMAVTASAVTTAALVPNCSITAIPSAINNAQSALLKWDSTEGAIFASLDNNIGAIAPDGQMVIAPNTTTVYTMHTWNSQGKGGYCSTTISVDGSGVISSIYNPTVTLQTLSTISASNSVILNNVPYTGAESTLYTLFLFVVLLSAGYVATTQRKVLSA